MRKLHFLLSIAIIAASAISPAAATTYTYTEGSASDVVPSFSFTTSLTGAALDNLAPNTDITSTITSPSILSLTGLFEPRGVPPQDLGNFPLGPGGFGGSYYNVVSGSVSVLIRTDAIGQITSWSISETIFASYPAFPGDPPGDFYCTYGASTTTGGGSLSLTADNDAGLCPNGTTSGTGTFSGSSGTAPTPLPATPPLLATGIGSLGLLGWRRKRKAQAVA